MSEGLAFYYHEMSDTDVGISIWRYESTFFASKENLEVSADYIFSRISDMAYLYNIYSLIELSAHD